MDRDERQLAGVVGVVEASLAGHIVAICQYGSAVDGGLRPASDLDVFVVVDRPLDDRQRMSLITGLREVSAPAALAESGRPVEVTVAQLAWLVPWPERPHREFQYGEWLRADFDDGFLSPQVVDLDLAPLVATVLTASVPIVGPEARDLLAPVPHHRLVRAMHTEAAELLDELESDTTNVLLTWCRMLSTASTGQIAPKDAAAEWIMQEHRPAGSEELRRARDTYRHGEIDGTYDPVEVARLAADLTGRLAQITTVE